MYDLNNVPESVLDLLLEERRVKIQKNLNGYIRMCFKPVWEAVKDYVDGNVDTFLEMMRKYHKIIVIGEIYSVGEIEKEAAEYLYSGYGPIVLSKFRRDGSDKIIHHYTVENLKAVIERRLKLKRYNDVKRFPLKVDGCLIPIKHGCLELQVSKIKKMNGGKFLIQLSFKDKYLIVIDEQFELDEILRRKVINCVLDTGRLILQVRAGRTWARSCRRFFEELFGLGAFEAIYFDEPLINRIRNELEGRTYQYTGSREDEIAAGGILKDLELGEMNVGDWRFIVEKILKKHGTIPLDIRDSSDFPSELVDYRLKTDSFHFDCRDEIESVDRKMEKMRLEFMKKARLELTVGHSRLYFRKFAIESVIDYVLDRLLVCLPETPPGPSPMGDIVLPKVV